MNNIDNRRRSAPFAIALVFAAAGAACGEEPGDEACSPSSGTICTVIGTTVAGLTADGLPPLETELYLPQDMTVGPDGNLYVLDWNNHRIRVIRDGQVDTIVGTGYLGDAPNGVARDIALNHPTHVAFDPDGHMIIAAWHNSKILRYDMDTEMIETICGTGARSFNGDELDALATALDLPSATAIDPSGRIFFSDQANQRIRVIDTDGVVSTYAGTGTQGFSGDGGPAIEAELHMPVSQSAPPAGRIEMDRQGAIYLADTSNHVIRRIGTDGIITTIAGTGAAGTGQGSVATEVALSRPSDVAVDADLNVYIADTMNDCVRKVAPDGTLTTFAGVCGQRGFDGDGGAPQEALLNRPYGVHVGPNGEVYIADTHNQVVRVVMP